MRSAGKEATRDRYGKLLVELAKKDKNVVALDCDLGRSTRSFNITDVDPGRFIEMGIAEQDMISTAAGMSRMGKIVFANSFAVFITGRSFDQIRQEISLPKLNVKICGSSAGVTQGPDGATHQSILDISLMRILPNMTVIVPADGNQTEEAMHFAYSHNGPVYLRLSRYQTGDFLNEDMEFTVGKAQVIKEGKEIVLASCGPVLKNVITASENLFKMGIIVCVVNFHTIKPFDLDTIRDLARNYKYIFSIEEHSIYGGLGSAIAESLAEEINPQGKASLIRIGVRDTFGESATAEELLKKHGLDASGIKNTVLQVIDNRIYDS
jgi:transketolase